MPEHPWDTSSNFGIGDFSGSDFQFDADPKDFEDNISLMSDASDISSTFPTYETPFATADAVATTFDSSMTTMFAGGFIGTAVKAFSEYTNQKNITSNALGQGQFGHAFDASQHVQQQNDFNSLKADTEGLEVGVGSLFGPEGLAAGLLVAGATELGFSNFEPNLNTTPSSNGNLVNDSDITP